MAINLKFLRRMEIPITVIGSVLLVLGVIISTKRKIGQVTPKHDSIDENIYTNIQKEKHQKQLLESRKQLSRLRD